MSEEIKKQTLTPAQEEALKTYVTGHEINPAEMENASALRREFLDDHIETLTWTENDLRFYRDIARRPANSTVAQYDIFAQHGKVGPTRFVSEIGVAAKNDPNIRRKTVNMKFVSDTKQVSLAANLVNNIQGPLEILTDDAIAVIAKTIEWASFYGDADLSAHPEPGAGLEFDGLAKLIDKANVIDAKGGPLTETLLNQAAVKIGKGFGTPTDAYMPIGVLGDFINNTLPRQYQNQANNSGQVNLGYAVQGFYSVRGYVRLHGSTVMDADNILDETVVPMPDAPLQPKVAATVKTGAKGEFRDEDLTEHTYKVVVNSESAASIPSEPVTATVANKDDGVELTVTLQNMYQQAPQFVSIYRQGKTTGEFYLIKRLGVKGQSEITFVDRNETLPETADVFIGEMTPNVVHLFELLPMMRLPLAQMNASITFSVLWYGALIYRALA